MIPRIFVAITAYIALLTVIAPGAFAQRPAGPVVEVAQGSLRGTKAGTIYEFKGIPYAAPPVGERRWAPPAPPESWSGVRSAANYGNACIQKPGLSGPNGGDPGPLSEDCLNLNVWTPSLKQSAKLPVVFWIHGGAYVFGGGTLPLYSGQPMAHKGVVYVSINYRLGALGFFGHPALKGASGGNVNNFGLMDQIAALNWVRANIAKFGGDPNDITIMGQSAGGKSVMALLASPLARGLFAKAAALSVYVLPDATQEKAAEVGAEVARAIGLDGANATLAELRAVPAEKFGVIEEPKASLGPVPIAGDKVLPTSIAETFRSGGEARVPLILSDTSDDASVIAAFGFDPAKIVEKLGAAGFALKILYPGVRDEAELGRQALRDAVFTMNTRWVADLRALRARTYRAYFDHNTRADRPKFPHGVPHGGDVSYYLNTLDIYEGTKNIATVADRRVAKRVNTYIVNFAKTGKPGTVNHVEWTEHRRLRDRTLVIGPNSIVLEKNFMRPRLSILIGITKIAGSLFSK